MLKMSFIVYLSAIDALDRYFALNATSYEGENKIRLLRFTERILHCRPVSQASRILAGSSIIVKIHFTTMLSPPGKQGSMPKRMDSCLRGRNIEKNLSSEGEFSCNSKAGGHN